MLPFKGWWLGTLNFAPTVYFYDCYGHISVYSVNQLVFLMDVFIVLCEVRSES